MSQPMSTMAAASLVRPKKLSRMASLNRDCVLMSSSKKIMAIPLTYFLFNSCPKPGKAMLHNNASMAFTFSTLC